MDVIYLDALFALNLLADYLLCLSAGRICGLYLRRKRYLLAAFLGALYAVAVVLPGCGFLAWPPLRLASGLGMGLTAFSAEQRPFRCAGVLLAVSAAYGGAIWALALAAGVSGPVPLSGRVLLLAFALCYAGVRLLFRLRAKRAEAGRAEIRLSFRGRESRFTALVDTGNSLCDPVSGSPVLVVCPHVMDRVVPGSGDLFAHLTAVELVELSNSQPELCGCLRLLPYSTLDGRGLLPAFRPDSLSVNGRSRPDLLVAVSPRASGEDFEALL